MIMAGRTMRLTWTLNGPTCTQRDAPSAAAPNKAVTSKGADSARIAVPAPASGERAVRPSAIHAAAPITQAAKFTRM
jgi:hypothetical protein